MDVQVDTVGLFEKFVTANDLKEILDAFNQLCSCLGLDPLDDQGFYHRLRSKLSSNWKAEKLWYLLDKRAAQKEYRKQRACLPLKVLVIGAGPCGLRSAIECALLGAKTVVIEKRDRFSRNNVLHLWPFVIQDLKSLGGKLFYPKFCAGSLDHISIRQLQCILLKVALVVGVEVHDSLGFDHLIHPEISQETGETLGWRAEFWPRNHYLREYQFQALIGADGKRNTIPCFQRKEMRGKLAIGVTANFVNGHSGPEERVQEIAGITSIFNQQFFKDMKELTKIDLENIVYYKDDTHYFVMCAKKQSLLDKNVIKKDCDDVPSLLSPENVNQSALLAYAREAADFSTDGALKGHLNYAVNHLGEPDVAMFDFTSLYSSLSSCRLEEKNGHKLLMAVVGDSLHEPFWPTGSGVARGFLGVLDTAWMLKCLCSGKMTALQVMAERENVYRLLAQTKPQTLNKNIQKYTIDPKSRYPSLQYTILPEAVLHLVVTDQSQFVDFVDASLVGHGNTINSPVPLHKGQAPAAKRRKFGEAESRYIQRQQLIRFVQAAINYSGLRVMNLTECWADGMMLAALIGRFRSDLVGWSEVQKRQANGEGDIREMMFDIVRKEHGLEPPRSIVSHNGAGDQGNSSWCPDKEEMFEYVSTLCEKLKSALLEQIEKLSASSAPKPATPTVANETPGPRHRSRHVAGVTQKFTLTPAEGRSIAEQAANVVQKRKAEKEEKEGTPDSSFHRSMSSPEMGKVQKLTFERERRREHSREEEQQMLAELMEEEDEMEAKELDLDLEEDEVKQWLEQWEQEETTRERHERRLDDVRQGLFQKRCYMAPNKWKSKPAMIEKLAPDRLREVESLLLRDLAGKVSDVERHKKKKPPIKTRKLDRRELEEMENKLEQTAMGSILFKKDYEKALSRPEELAIAAKTADLKRKAAEGFSQDPHGRFNSFDDQLKALDKKLKQPNLSGAFKVGDLSKVHKISALPKKAPVPTPDQLASRGLLSPRSSIGSLEETSVNQMATVRKSPIPVSGTPESQQPCCYLCGGRVYFAEKVCVEGFSMHSRCFRCAYCDTVLRLGAYGFERSEVYGNRFFCRTHLSLSMADKLKRLKMKGALNVQPFGQLPPESKFSDLPRPPPVGEVRPLQTKNLSLKPQLGKCDSNGWGKGTRSTTGVTEVSPTNAVKTKPGMIERPPPIVHFPEQKEEAKGETEEETLVSNKSTARKTLDAILSPKIERTERGVQNGAGEFEPNVDVSHTSEGFNGVTGPEQESCDKAQEIANLNEKAITVDLYESPERPVTPPRTNPPSLIAEDTTRTPLADIRVEGGDVPTLSAVTEKKPKFVPEPLSRDLLSVGSSSSGGQRSFGLSEMSFSTANQSTPERAEFVFHSPFHSDDALSVEEDKGGQEEREGLDKERSNTEESGEVSDDEEESGASSEEDEDELAFSEDEWADLEKTISLKRGSKALTYDEAAELARTWRQRQKAGKESSSSQDSDDEDSEVSETFEEIAGERFKDAKTFTTSISKFDQKVTDKSIYFTPSAIPEKQEGFNFNTSKATSSALSQDSSIPFADKSPEKPPLGSDTVLFRLRPGGALAGIDRWIMGDVTGPSPIRQAKIEEFQRLKEEARLKAKMKSDDELGISGPRLYGSESRLPIVKQRKIDEKLAGQPDWKYRTASLQEEDLLNTSNTKDAKPCNDIFAENNPQTANPEAISTPEVSSAPDDVKDTKNEISEVSSQSSKSGEKNRKLSGIFSKLKNPFKKPPSPTPAKSVSNKSNPQKEISPDSTNSLISPNSQTIPKVKSPESTSAADTDSIVLSPDSVPEPQLVKTVSIESKKENQLKNKIGRKHTPNRNRTSPGREMEGKDSQNGKDVMKMLGLRDRNVTTRRRGPAKATIDEASLGSEDSLDKADGKNPKSPEKYVSPEEAAEISEREVRRIQKAAENLVRQQEHKRAYEAQDIQRKLQEVDVRKMEVEQSGNKLERRLRDDPEDRWALEQWLVLVNERNGLEQYENDLNLRKRELELEQEHARLQRKLRDLMTTGQREKTREDLQAEHRVLEEMLLVVAQRDALVSQLDRDKQRDKAAQSDIAQAMAKKGFTYRNFSPVFIERVRPYDSSKKALEESEV